MPSAVAAVVNAQGASWAASHRQAWGTVLGSQQSAPKGRGPMWQISGLAPRAQQSCQVPTNAARSAAQACTAPSPRAYEQRDTGFFGLEWGARNLSCAALDAVLTVLLVAVKDWVIQAREVGLPMIVLNVQFHPIHPHWLCEPDLKRLQVRVNLVHVASGRPCRC